MCVYLSSVFFFFLALVVSTLKYDFIELFRYLAREIQCLHSLGRKIRFSISKGLSLRIFYVRASLFPLSFILARIPASVDLPVVALSYAKTHRYFRNRRFAFRERYVAARALTL